MHGLIKQGWQQHPHNQYHSAFRWWAIKCWVGWEDATQAEADDIVDMLCMGGEL